MDRNEKVVYVLGSGFSRAISDDMPLTDELGNEVRRRLADADTDIQFPQHEFAYGYFEAWLSRLSEKQPDLTVERNLRNRAAFLRIATEVAAIIEERERRALDDSPRSWLTDLVAVWHRQRATIVTFNYDRLIEKALGAAFPGPTTDNRPIPHDVLRGLPRLPAGHEPMGRGALSSFRIPDSFRLLKLHGSLGWYSAHDDRTGATLGRVPEHEGWEPQASDGLVAERLLPGTDVFLVPPSASKSSFYGNSILRSLWRSAAEALGQADRVVLVGYSVPVTDAATLGLLAEQISQPGATSEVWIVDPAPEKVSARLRLFGLSDDRMRPVDSVDTLHAEEVGRLSAGVREDLEHCHGQVSVQDPYRKVFPARTLTSTDGRHILNVTEPGDPNAGGIKVGNLKAFRTDDQPLFARLGARGSLVPCHSAERGPGLREAYLQAIRPLS